MAMWDIKNELGKEHELFKQVERNYNDVHETYGIMEEFMGKEESMNESSVPLEPVIFKKDRKDGTVVAFFPETLHDGSCNPGKIMSYEHNGQHGEASIDYFHECRPCSEEEYADLLTELEGIYTDGLKVVKRMR